MAYKEIDSTPKESAQIMRWLRNAPDRVERNARIARAPLPSGSSISFKIENSTVFDQHRIHLSSEMASNMRRVWGTVVSLRNESISANTVTPASAQILLRLNWLDESQEKYRNFFVRCTAFSADYSPRIALGKPCTLRLGDIVSGVIEKPHSERNSATIAAWDFGDIAEWTAFSPYSLILPAHFTAAHTDIYDLPQLGGCHFSRPQLISLSIAPPLVPTETMKMISARTQDLKAASIEIEAIDNSRCDGSLGCRCERCVAARNTIVRNIVVPLPPADARPAPPEIAPPRMKRVPPTIHENSPWESTACELEAYGARTASNTPRSLPLLTPPVAISPKKAPPPTRTLALEDATYSPRSVSMGVEGMNSGRDKNAPERRSSFLCPLYLIQNFCFFPVTMGLYRGNVK